MTRHNFVPHLPYLRRYARALTGSQAKGDAAVRSALTAVLNEKARVAVDLTPRVALYRLFHSVWAAKPQKFEASDELNMRQLAPEQRVQALSSEDRAALLLTSVEGFSVSEAGIVLGQRASEVERAIVHAQTIIEKQLASRVLIIEDESVIALDLESMVAELGHEPVGTASTKDEAVAKARALHPGLVLADINLGDGGSGMDAVSEILRSFDIPVIFITAYPERLLTGERPEPTYLITKPFLPETVQATIGQALFFHTARCEPA